MSALWLTVSFLAGVVVTWQIRNAARKMGIVNHPNPIVPQHRAPVAYMGGVAIALSVSFVTALARITGEKAALVPVQVWAPAILFLLLGTVDDLRPLRAVTKLLIQVAASASAVALGLVWRVTGNGAADAGFSLLWFLLLVNAFNVTDVCDGLVAGLAIIMLAFAGARGTDAWIPVVTMGATLGFLAFNRPPASIFLGDGGSHLLGFLVGASLLSVAPSSEPVHWKHVAASALVTGVVLMEVVLLIYSRVRAGIPWWRGSPHHFSLRMQALGLSRLATDLVAWGAAIALCAIAWFLPLFSDWIAVIIFAAVALALAAACRLLLRWGVQRLTVQTRTTRR